jgi:Sensors of blue-light using FAD
MSNLLRLIYVSRAASAVDSASIDALLKQARERNEELGLTGVLCTGRGHFVQLLEGPQANVVNLYARICRDKRHEGSELVSVALADERAFPKWSMGHIEGEMLGESTHKKLVGMAVIEYKLAEHAKLLQSIFRLLSKSA